MLLYATMLFLRDVLHTLTGDVRCPHCRGWLDASPSEGLETLPGDGPGAPPEVLTTCSHCGKPSIWAIHFLPTPLRLLVSREDNLR